MCDIQMRDALRDKEKVATQATLDHIEQQEWNEQAALKEGKGMSIQKGLPA